MVGVRAVSVTSFNHSKRGGSMINPILEMNKQRIRKDKCPEYPKLHSLDPSTLSIEPIARALTQAALP